MFEVDPEVQRMALGVPLSDLLDLLEEANRNHEGGVAARLRSLIDGRLSEIEHWSMGSSIVRANMHGHPDSRPPRGTSSHIKRCRAAAAGTQHDAHTWYGNVEAGEPAEHHRCLGAGPAVRLKF